MEKFDLMFEECIADLAEEVTKEPCAGGDAELQSRIAGAVPDCAKKFVTKLKEEAGDKTTAAIARYAGTIEPIVVAAKRKTSGEGFTAWVVLGISETLTRTLSEPQMLNGLASVANLPTE